MIALRHGGRGVRLGSRGGHHPRDRSVCDRAGAPRLRADATSSWESTRAASRPTPRPSRAARACPGLLVFRFDSRLFYANASLFVDRIQELIAAAPSHVRWLILDCSSIGDIDYSASLNLAGLIAALHAEKRVFALADVDPNLMKVLHEARDSRITSTTRTSTRRCRKPLPPSGRTRRRPRSVDCVRRAAHASLHLPIMHIMSTQCEKRTRSGRTSPRPGSCSDGALQ